MSVPPSTFKGEEEEDGDTTTPRRLTSSHTGTFYFAYGSNLSAHQMSLRLPHSRQSSEPVAIARLDRHAWIICERGYANVVCLPPSASSTTTRTTIRESTSLDKNDDNDDDDETTVWGVVYNMSSDDESVLDRYEGHDARRNPRPTPNTDTVTRHERPFEQGNWDYNKLYLPVTVTKWLREPGEYLDQSKSQSQPQSQSSSEEEVRFTKTPKTNPSDSTTIRVLVYVDEQRTQPGRINREYIGRMNRAIDESVALGLPVAWVEKVMRRFIPPGIGVEHDLYVGTDRGFVETEATEAYDEVMEARVRAWRKARNMDGNAL